MGFSAGTEHSCVNEQERFFGLRTGGPFASRKRARMVYRMRRVLAAVLAVMVTAALLPAAEIRAAETWAESAAAGMVPESAEAVSREAKAETEAAPESGAAQEAGAETSPLISAEG